MNRIIIISGPTASGKTKFAIEYAKKNNGTIINADSRQIFMDLPILSAQPTEIEKGKVKHVLYSYLKPTESCNIALWLKLIEKEIANCFNKKELPIIVGGTGLYISGLINGISKIPETTKNIRQEVVEMYNNIGYLEFKKKAMEIDIESTIKLNANDKQRLMRIIEIYKTCGEKMSILQKQENILIYPKEYFYHINMSPPKEKVYQNCKIRFTQMLENNLINEITLFRKKYENFISNTIGYKECLDYIDNKISKNYLIETVSNLTRKYAKRQYTWFNHQFTNFDEKIMN
jgi:tRNA dimethylallyltransferase